MGNTRRRKPGGYIWHQEIARAVSAAKLIRRYAQELHKSDNLTERQQRLITKIVFSNSEALEALIELNAIEGGRATIDEIFSHLNIDED